MLRRCSSCNCATSGISLPANQTRGYPSRSGGSPNLVPFPTRERRNGSHTVICWDATTWHSTICSPPSSNCEPPDCAAGAYSVEFEPEFGLPAVALRERESAFAQGATADNLREESERRLEAPPGFEPGMEVCRPYRVVIRSAWLRLLVLDGARFSLLFGRCCSEVAPNTSPPLPCEFAVRLGGLRQPALMGVTASAVDACAQSFGRGTAIWQRRAGNA
jgi:hypothetical protein